MDDRILTFRMIQTPMSAARSDVAPAVTPTTMGVLIPPSWTAVGVAVFVETDVLVVPVEYISSIVYVNVLVG